MSNINIEKKMKRLWREIFNDPDEYIEMLFNCYFNEDNIAYRCNADILISSLFGIEYKFKSIRNISECNNADINSIYIKSMYLCGLSTRNEYRNRGIMSSLINEFIIRLYARNFAFSFLVPANVGLIKYYEDRDFVCVSYNTCIRYIRGNKFIRYIYDIDYKNKYKIIDVSSFFSKEINSDNNIQEDCLHRISCYISSKNCHNNKLYICKSLNDIWAIIADNIISDGCIYAVEDNNNAISGIVFAQCNEFMEVTVQRLFSDNDMSRELLLNAVQEHYGENANITVVYSEDDIHESKVYASYSLAYSHDDYMGEIIPHDDVFSIDQEAKPFAMARIIKLSEILIFAAALYPGRKYSILVTHDFLPENCGFYEVSGGRCLFTPIEEISPVRLEHILHDCDVKPEYFHLTVREVAALIWRKKSSSLIDDVIAIPRLPLDISLMLE